MEEADLLKERLQAITDKRRIQEEISRKRRQIEEEKLKLQYIKKKALRDQWLMDGLNQQSEEELEATRLQAQDEQQQSDMLQSNIHRMELEIQALEKQELDILTNEEVVLKRLKEVERSAEDIIKKAISVGRGSGEPALIEGHSTAGDHSSVSVTMETTEQPELPTDCEVNESSVPGKDVTANIKPDCSGTDSWAPPGSHQLFTLMESSPCEARQDPEKAVVPGAAHEDLNRKESITSSVSDTPSSADSVYENEVHRKRQDTPEPSSRLELDTHPGPGPEPHHSHQHMQENFDRESSLLWEPDPHLEQDVNLEPDPDLEQDADLELGPDLEQDADLKPNTDFEQDSHLEQEPDLEPDPDLEPGPDLDLDPDLQQDADLEQDRHLEKDLDFDQDPGQEQYPGSKQDAALMLYPRTEQYPYQDLYPQSEPDPDVDICHQAHPDHEIDPCPQSEPNSNLDLYPDTEPDLEMCPELDLDAGDLNSGLDSFVALPTYIDNNSEHSEIPFGLPALEESMLEQCIRAEALSDGSSESFQDRDCNPVVECQRALSDEETDEKWRTIFSSSINKEDDDSYLDSLQLSAQDLFVQKVEERDFAKQDNDLKEVCFEVPHVDEVLKQHGNVISFSVPQQEVKYNQQCIQGLAKILEDEGKSGQSSGQNCANLPQHTSTDTTKRLPKDFCVIQETKSENVSTEHVDFQSARKQWREKEEQTKNRVILPTTKQPSFHGSHSFMYTPVRNIERPPRWVPELESLTLTRDVPHTQFSPCSEDSGLDDCSYRSPHDDQETPVEKEIRLSMEREEHFQRERALSKMGKSTDCAPSRGFPRSVSTPLTPSFIITASPTKEPVRHQVPPNNVVIVNPGNEHEKDKMSTCPAEWHSEDGGSNLVILETSNLIIRSASEFSLSRTCEHPQEKTFLNNPFFKLRSRSSVSLVDEEIRMVKQREEELKKERAGLYGGDRSNCLDPLAFGHSVDIPMKCKSSPSSPMKTIYKMDRTTLSCDHRFLDAFGGGRRKSAMAQRWEAGEFTKTD